MLFGDLLVYQWLGVVWFVCFVVVVVMVVDQVDDYVMFELYVVVDGQLGDEQYGFGIVVVDVEDWCLNYFCYVGGVFGGMCIVLVVGGEIDLVVDYQVDGVIGFVGVGL